MKIQKSFPPPYYKKFIVAEPIFGMVRESFSKKIIFKNRSIFKEL